MLNPDTQQQEHSYTYKFLGGLLAIVRYDGEGNWQFEKWAESDLDKDFQDVS